MNICILAGGFGTRLAPILGGVPKPLAPIGKKVFLEIILENLAVYNINEVFLCLHHKAQEIIDWVERFQKYHNLGFRINIVIEDIPLDTGGAVKNCCVKTGLSSDLLVMNADTFISADLAGIMTVSDNTIALICQAEKSRFGTVLIDDKNRVLNFVEKSSEGEGFVYSGVCKLSSETICGFKADKFSLERDFFPMLARQRILRSVILDGYMTDIGVPSDYLRFCNEYRILNER